MVSYFWPWHVLNMDLDSAVRVRVMTHALSQQFCNADCGLDALNKAPKGSTGLCKVRQYMVSMPKTQAECPEVQLQHVRSMPRHSYDWVRSGQVRTALASAG